MANKCWIFHIIISQILFVQTSDPAISRIRENKINGLLENDDNLDGFFESQLTNIYSQKGNRLTDIKNSILNGRVNSLFTAVNPGGGGLRNSIYKKYLNINCTSPERATNDRGYSIISNTEFNDAVNSKKDILQKEINNYIERPLFLNRNASSSAEDPEKSSLNKNNTGEENVQTINNDLNIYRKYQTPNRLIGGNLVENARYEKNIMLSDRKRNMFSLNQHKDKNKNEKDSQRVCYDTERLINRPKVSANNILSDEDMMMNNKISKAEVFLNKDTKQNEKEINQTSVQQRGTYINETKKRKSIFKVIKDLNQKLFTHKKMSKPQLKKNYTEQIEFNNLPETSRTIKDYSVGEKLISTPLIKPNVVNNQETVTESPDKNFFYNNTNKNREALLTSQNKEKNNSEKNLRRIIQKNMPLTANQKYNLSFLIPPILKKSHENNKIKSQHKEKILVQRHLETSKTNIRRQRRAELQFEDIRDVYMPHDSEISIYNPRSCMTGDIFLNDLLL